MKTLQKAAADLAITWTGSIAIADTAGDIEAPSFVSADHIRPPVPCVRSGALLRKRHPLGCFPLKEAERRRANPPNLIRSVPAEGTEQA